jgi:hypothetical protein
VPELPSRSSEFFGKIHPKIKDFQTLCHTEYASRQNHPGTRILANKGALSQHFEMSNRTTITVELWTRTVVSRRTIKEVRSDRRGDGPPQNVESAPTVPRSPQQLNRDGQNFHLLSAAREEKE